MTPVTLCINMLETNCTELAELGEHDSFGKDVSWSAKYLEICLTKRMRPHSLKLLQPQEREKQK